MSRQGLHTLEVGHVALAGGRGAAAWDFIKGAVVVGEVALLDALADAAGGGSVAQGGIALRQTEALTIVTRDDDGRGVLGELVLQGVRVLQLGDFGWGFGGVEGELF